MMQSEAEPGAVYWALLSPYWLPLNESWDGGAEAFLARSSEVPSAVLELYAAHWCQSEVNNGGLHQFFFNTTGILGPEAAKAFELIGLTVWSKVLSDAMAYFGEPFPRERRDRLRKLPDIGKGARSEWDPFVELDDRFYRCKDAERNRWEEAADAYARRT